jgi:hypothetical protein
VPVQLEKAIPSAASVMVIGCATGYNSVVDHRVHVDLRGIIALLSDHLYSSPQVFLRELLQNATDAITERKNLPGQAGSFGRATPLPPGSMPGTKVPGSRRRFEKRTD